MILYIGEGLLKVDHFGVQLFLQRKPFVPRGPHLFPETSRLMQFSRQHPDVSGQAILCGPFERSFFCPQMANTRFQIRQLLIDQPKVALPRELM